MSATWFAAILFISLIKWLECIFQGKQTKKGWENKNLKKITTGFHPLHLVGLYNSATSSLLFPNASKLAELHVITWRCNNKVAGIHRLILFTLVSCLTCRLSLALLRQTHGEGQGHIIFMPNIPNSAFCITLTISRRLPLFSAHLKSKWSFFLFFFTQNI